MNILVVHNLYKMRGGEESVFEAECALLRNHGHNVVTYVRSNAELDDLGLAQKIMLPANTVFSFKTFRAIKKLIKQNAIDIVHVHNTCVRISPSVFWATRSLGVPVVQTLHNFRYICPKATFLRNGAVCNKCVDGSAINAICNRCYRGSLAETTALVATNTFHRLLGTYCNAGFIFLTDFNKEEMLKKRFKRPLFNEKLIYVKPNFSICDEVPLRAEQRANIFVFVGRLSVEKGIRPLLQAWRDIKDAELVIIGTGPEEKWCRQFIRDNNMDNVKMIGLVARDRVFSFLRQSRAAIMPSIWYEGMPMAVVESFSCGTPVLGSSIGNVSEMIIDGYNGYHIDPYNALSISEGVKKITASDLIDNTFTCFQALYSSQINYEMLISIYDDLIKKMGK